MSMAPRDSAAGGELYRRLQLSFLLRVILVTFLLGATVVIQLSQTESFLTRPLLALYFLSGITYFITLVSIIALRFVKRLNTLAYLQIIWEIIFVTALIYVTGGRHSIFAFLFLLAIIIGGTLQYQRGSFLAALAGTICYGIMIGGMEADWIPPLIGENQPAGWDEIIYVFFINLAAMFGIAFLSSYLTEKLRATGDELQESKRYRDELEALNDDIVLSLTSGLITLDLDNRITSFNQAAEDITGFSKSSVMEENVREFIPELAEIISLLSSGTGQTASRREITWRSPEGENLHLEFRISPLFGAGNVKLGTLVILNDVTEIREMEQRLRKSDRMAVVGRLAAGIAHEIRNPLASISGSIQVLAQDLELDLTSQRLMRIIFRETERLNSLITDFLLYARPAPRNIQKVRLDRLIPDIIEVYKNRADIPGDIKWSLEVEPSLEIETDPKLLEQILWNLVNNAVDSMADRGELCIRAYSERPGKDSLSDGNETGAEESRQPVAAIEVEDSGSGISPEIKDKIFDPFFTTRDTGTGLGLSTVYRIVEAMEGSVAVKDAQEKGTVFEIKIPVRQKPAEETGSGESNSNGAGLTGGG